MNIAPWLTVSSEEEVEWTVMRLRHERRRHAVDGREGMFTLAQAPTWVNIVPITTDGHIVLVEQFRHGTRSTTLELPGGVVFNNEDPRLAAQRECLEETGWGSDRDAESLGIVDPNPAFMENTCHVYVWNDCRLQQGQHLDPLEDIAVHVIGVDDFLSRIKNRTIRHSLVLSAVALALLDSRFTVGK